MKSLPPSLRKRKRYIAFRIIPEGEVEKEDMISAIWESTLSLFGEFEGVNFRLIEVGNNAGIVMCPHREVNKLKIALTMIDRAGDKKVLPIILGVAGTIKSCRKKYLEVLKNANSANGIRQGDNHIQP